MQIYDLLSCSHYPLKGLAAGRVAGTIPHSDAASQNALDGASVEGAHDGGRGSGSSEFVEEVETLLCFLGQCCSVVGPGEVLCDVYTQELGAAHSLHGRTIHGQRSMQRVHSPEVNDNLLRLLHIQREIVVTAPPGQAAHLAPVVCLISVANETHHSRVIRKLNEKVRVVWRCAVVGQQSEEEGAQHTSLGGPCVQCDGAGCVTADPYCLRSPGQEVQLHSDVLSPSWTSLWISCWGMIVLNAELKSMNSNLTYVSVLSRCVRAGWRAVAMASSVKRLDLSQKDMCVSVCVCLHHWFVDSSLFLWQASMYLAARKIQSCFSPNKYWSCVFLFNILKSG